VAEDSKMYSAKQVASRIGTDAKQLRKFFRDENSGYTPAGQGGRYDFPEEEIPKIKAKFDTWNSTKTRRNRAPSPQAKLASASGLIPGQRKDSPTPTVRRSKDNKEGLHHNALDDDTLQDRFQGIAARVEKHGLTMKQGRFVPLPEGYTKKTKGLTNTTRGNDDTAQPQELDFSEPAAGPSDDELLALMDELSLEDDAYPDEGLEL
jgi:hypothetical protein